jgi:hypothetical protein
MVNNCSAPKELGLDGKSEHAKQAIGYYDITIAQNHTGMAVF